LPANLGWSGFQELPQSAQTAPLDNVETQLPDAELFEATARAFSLAVPEESLQLPVKDDETPLDKDLEARYSIYRTRRPEIQHERNF